MEKKPSQVSKILHKFLRNFTVIKVPRVVEMKNIARSLFLVVTDSNSTEARLNKDVPIEINFEVYWKTRKSDNLIPGNYIRQFKCSRCSGSYEITEYNKRDQFPNMSDTGQSTSHLKRGLAFINGSETSIPCTLSPLQDRLNDFESLMNL